MTVIDELLTERQTAEHLGVAQGTLTQWRCTGRQRLPYVKVGGKVMYRPRDIQEFIERNVIDGDEAATG